jgi:hypothetical protein
LLVGTGLTAVDVALSLSARQPGRPILAVSRHGLLPSRHRDAPTEVWPTATPAGEGPVRLAELEACLRSELAAAAGAGVDWRGRRRVATSNSWSLGSDACRGTPSIPRRPSPQLGNRASSDGARRQPAGAATPHARGATCHGWPSGHGNGPGGPALRSTSCPTPAEACARRFSWSSTAPVR